MERLTTWFDSGSITHTLLILSIVIVAGLALGHIRIFKIGLGIAGVLFAGLFFGHIGFEVNGQVLDFAREFGLILFVYAIGIQVGPSFLSSFRRQGLKLNMLATAGVAMGIGITILLIFLTGEPAALLIGIMCGAVTNTPSLGAAQQALQGCQTGLTDLPSLGYAVAYPVGAVGVILVIILSRIALGIRIPDEEKRHKAEDTHHTNPVQVFTILVTNRNLLDLTFASLADIGETPVEVLSARRQGKEVALNPDNPVLTGDLIKIRCRRNTALDLAFLVGDPTFTGQIEPRDNLAIKSILLRDTSLDGKPLNESGVSKRFGVAITRVNRAGFELDISPSLILHRGDRLTLAGEHIRVNQAIRELGHISRERHGNRVLSIFLGIIFGLLLGMIPIYIPGTPAPISLGLIGGPLLAAVILGAVGRWGPFNWELPDTANHILRDMGVTLFLACVGLRAGGSFISSFQSGNGFYWVGLACIIAFVPALLVVLFARFILKMNFLSICGLLSGGMTNPPALSYADSITQTDEPAIAHATVYALAMFLRVLSTQVMVLFMVCG